MDWIKWGTPFKGKRYVSTWGEFMGIDEHGRIGQIRLDNGKFYHDYDLARHYPIKKGRFTHYCQIQLPKE